MPILKIKNSDNTWQEVFGGTGGGGGSADITVNNVAADETGNIILDKSDVGIYTSSSEPTGAKDGDIWINSSDDEAIKILEGGTWAPVSSASDFLVVRFIGNMATCNVEEIEAAVSAGKIVLFFYNNNVYNFKEIADGAASFERMYVVDGNNYVDHKDIVDTGYVMSYTDTYPLLPTAYGGADDYVLTSNSGVLAWKEPTGGAQVQVDYEQNDSTAVDYIKNRPFYEEGELTQISAIEETTIDFSHMQNNVYVGTITTDLVIEEGQTYIINFDGVEYIETGRYDSFMEDLCIGDPYLVILYKIYGIVNFPCSKPFFISRDYNDNTLEIIATQSQEATHTFSIKKGIKVIETTIIDDIYTFTFMDDSYFTVGIPFRKLVEGAIYTVTINNTDYESVCEYNDGSYALGADNFYISFSSELTMMMYADPDATTETIDVAVKITGFAPGLKQIDNKYIDIDGVTRNIDVLPAVTTSNNGQILGVSGGEWVAMDAPSGSGLPTVTTSNNGQILGVSGGTWTVMNAPSGLPTVTTEDNDKVLTVVDGVWTVSELPETTDDSFKNTHIYFVDQSNGKDYRVYMNNGVLTTEDFSIMQDFIYSPNADGSVTLLEWKGTLNGVESTECMVPDVEVII